MMSPEPDNSRSTTVGSAVVAAGVVACAVLAWSFVVAAGVSRPDNLSVPTLGSTRPRLTEPPPEAGLFPMVASVDDAELHHGVWYVLDRDNHRVHRFDQQGTLLGSFAGKGDGPGEVRGPRAVTAHADTIVVASRDRLQLYLLDGTIVARRRVESPSNCGGAILGDIASSPFGLLLLFNCDLRSEVEARVLLETDEATYTPLVARPSQRRGRSPRLDPLRGMTVLAEHPDGFVFGHPGDDCLALYDLGGHELEQVCHERVDRIAAPAIAETDLEELRGRSRVAGIALDMPEHLPPFTKVFVGAHNELLYRVPTPEDLDVFRLVGRDGSEVSPEIPAAPILFASGSSVLAGWHELDGARIAIYETSRD